MTENAVCGFSDVSPEDWGYKYIASAYEKRNNFRKTKRHLPGRCHRNTRSGAYFVSQPEQTAISPSNEIKRLPTARGYQQICKKAASGSVRRRHQSGYPDGSFVPAGNATQGNVHSLQSIC